ncbi:MAG: ABC transporter substrate-binding protein [Alphaproteobacteria bacterium]|nr:ABC transporter substrate-binding protein [Alphaproteobacteria bacterium]
MSLRQKITNNLLGPLLVLGLTATGAMADGFSDTPALAEMVKSGGLPPVAERLPAQPRVVEGETIGQYGGDLRISMARAKDTRMMTVYGYARLVGFDQSYNLVSDILESFDVEDARIFTLRLRKGHKWSDGHPFTTEDFRYWWEDVANNTDLAPLGPPIFMKVDSELPTVEIIDDVTIRYTWSKPNPSFLPLLAGPRPPFIYRPAHYMKQFHAKYADQAELDAAIKKRRMRSWAALHNASDNMYNFDNPQLPTLQPWFNTVRPPQQQFIFERNPYFHRVDSKGQQLPYIDRVLMNIADSKLIPAKAAAGEADLQARNIFMSHYTFLKRAEEKKKFKTLLWNTALGSKIALYPNMHHKDPVWRGLFRDVRFRRALSLATDRDEINQVIYFGLAQPANNTVLPESPLFRDELQTVWADFDPDQAEALLDEIGLDKRDDDGVRLLPDGRRLEIVIETAGEETEQVDVLELLHDTWLDVGIKIFTRPSQREVFRNRIFAGDTMMAVWFGVDNGIVSADMSPGEFTPTRQIQYQWPKWGQYFETGGKAGEEIDMPAPKELFDLFRKWRVARSTEDRTKIWQRILDIHADQVFTIGIVCCTKQPVVVNNRLKNVPREGVYAWNPGAFFGVYLPDTFYFSDAAQ